MQAVQRNGTLYMHVVFAKTGKTIDPDDPGYNEELVFGRTEREYPGHGHPYRVAGRVAVQMPLLSMLANSLGNVLSNLR